MDVVYIRRGTRVFGTEVGTDTVGPGLKGVRSLRPSEERNQLDVFGGSVGIFQILILILMSLLCKRQQLYVYDPYNSSWGLILKEIIQFTGNGALT